MLKKKLERFNKKQLVQIAQRVAVITDHCTRDGTIQNILSSGLSSPALILVPQTSPIPSASGRSLKQDRVTDSGLQGLHDLKISNVLAEHVAETKSMDAVKQIAGTGDVPPNDDLNMVQYVASCAQMNVYYADNVLRIRFMCSIVKEEEKALEHVGRYRAVQVLAPKSWTCQDQLRVQLMHSFLQGAKQKPVGGQSGYLTV
ncbi:hypothetical protein MIR68_009875 [Amoeboaphelidium protococcarum]|nr:hypothetical protein MIR68_009875 [Amoeboaphelidium protococcarum]